MLIAYQNYFKWTKYYFTLLALFSDSEEQGAVEGGHL